MSNTPIPTQKRVTLPRLPADEEGFPPSANLPVEATGSPAASPAESIRCADTPAPAPSIGRNKVIAHSEAPLLQWSNGKPIARAAGSTERFAPFVGFTIEAGKDAELDAILSAARTPQMEIKHQRQGGAEIVTHWSLGEELRFFPLTQGPLAPTVALSLAGRTAALTAAAGIGLAWPAGERSRLALRGYVDTLFRVGYPHLVQLTVKSKMSDALFVALLDHVRVCEAADQLINREKHPDLICLHELALPLGPGEEQEWGKGDTATVVPLVSQHPEEITMAYLRTIWRRESLDAQAREDWAAVQAWAEGYAGEGEEFVTTGDYSGGGK